MKKLETIQEFYQARHKWIPNEIRNSLGHFNVFSLEPYIGKGAEPLEYRRREWYNITLVYGQGKLHYAEKTYEVKQRAIAFNNPQTPFSWQHRDLMTGGYYCLFNKQFVSKDTSLIEYPLFQPGDVPLYELTKKEASVVDGHFQRIFKELNSSYVHKYEIAKIVIAELLHFTMKLEAYQARTQKTQSPSQHTVMRFLEMLEHQFPIENPLQTVPCRSASDFAEKLNIHTNHLNRLVKEVTEKTTTQVIAERFLQEAKALLRHTHLNVSEIAFALGFRETTHFNNFFKKHTSLTPLQYRNV